MPGPHVARLTLLDLTMTPASGYTGYIGSRERITPMNENRGIAAVEHVATGLHKTLVAEFESPMGGVEIGCEWTGEDFNRIILTSPAGELFIVVTSVVGEEGADVRVVVFDSETFECEGPLSEAHTREVGRVARAVAAIPEVNSVWPDPEWSKTFLVSLDLEEADS